MAIDRFDPAKQAVAINLATLLADVDLTRDEGGAVGCMSSPTDPECAPIFSALGLNLSETRPNVGDAGEQAEPGLSSIFKVRARR